VEEEEKLLQWKKERETKTQQLLLLLMRKKEEPEPEEARSSSSSRAQEKSTKRSAEKEREKRKKERFFCRCYLLLLYSPFDHFESLLMTRINAAFSSFKRVLSALIESIFFNSSSNSEILRSYARFSRLSSDDSIY
jgi:hypothetical protein